MTELLTQAQGRSKHLEIENRLLREEIRLMRIEKFGAKSEQLNDRQLALLEEEPSVNAAEVQNEAQVGAKDKELGPSGRGKNKRQNHPGRLELPAHLPRVEEIIPAPDCDQHCECCQQPNPIIGYEIKEELDVEPSRYYVRVIKREKRACKQCPEQGVSTAPIPARIVEKGKLGDGFIVEALIRKYADHLPFFRQSVMLKRDAGVEISRQVIGQSVLRAGVWLKPIQQQLKEDLINGGYIQADETPIGVQSDRVVGRNHKGYVFEYSRPGGAVVYDFRMSRGRDGPKEFLKDYGGILQTDGYVGYNEVEEQCLRHAGCWAHGRRYFHKAHQLAKNDPMPREVLREIGRLYQIEEQAREAQLTPEGRLALRKEHSEPIVAGLKERVLEIRAQVLPKSALGKACRYVLGQWSRLEVFLEYGQVEIDNNWCENAIRPVVLGRKNWLHIGDESAGPKIAAIMSVIETCRRLKIDYRQYLTEVLPKLPSWSNNRVDELTPISWQASRSI